MFFSLKGAGKLPHSAGRLFHQYGVDCYARIEQGRLNFISKNQVKIRAELYQGVHDAIAAGEVDAAKIGHRVILPSSFIGGPRHMYQLYQDAMGIVGRLGKPSLFITFTCNPEWKEINNEVLPGQTPNDRPDLCARVFHLKLKELLNDLFQKGKEIFGKVIGHIHVIEFQVKHFSVIGP